MKVPRTISPERESRPLVRPDAIQAGLTWYVVRTNPRCEERAFAGLLAACFAAYLPRGSKLVRRRHMKARQRVPFALLTGYLFVGMPKNRPNFYALREVDGVAAILGRQETDLVGAAPRYVSLPVRIVEEFHSLERRSVFDEPEPSERSFEAGDTVVIKDGPLRGTEFTFDDYFGKNTAKVLKKILGATRPLQIPLVDLRKVA